MKVMICVILITIIIIVIIIIIIDIISVFIIKSMMKTITITYLFQYNEYR